MVGADDDERLGRAAPLLRGDEDGPEMRACHSLDSNGTLDRMSKMTSLGILLDGISDNAC